eukprot:11205860-Lingulodinium_polyedra.AAC.1
MARKSFSPIICFCMEGGAATNAALCKRDQAPCCPGSGRRLVPLAACPSSVAPVSQVAGPCLV